MEATAELRERIHSLPWVHTIDLGHGLVTPGAWPPSPLIRAALDTIDFRGKTVLDIGCWDGLWSFEAERRGAAEVYATDCTSQRPHREQPTFALAHRVLESRVKYYPDLSVYRVADLGMRDFDIVLFCGVYYHLRNPLLALARLREVMKPGAILVIEGEVIHDERRSFVEFFYRDPYAGDYSTWWVPSIRCLREWVECSYFEIVRHCNIAEGPRQPGAKAAARKWAKTLLRRRPRYSRSLLLARAVSRPDPLNPYADEDFAGVAAIV
jgi:tRNA (mo5U34)-methyltransferase